MAACGFDSVSPREMASATPANNHMGPTLAHGWVSTNCGRGTIDILWSCLFTVFLCVWTAIYLPVPLYRGDKPLSRRDKIVRSKIIPALLSVIAPEFLGYTAMIEFLKARKRVKLLRRLTKTRLSLTHGFFLDMGGIRLTIIDGKYRQLSVRDIDQALREVTELRECEVSIHTEEWASQLGKISE